LREGKKNESKSFYINLISIFTCYIDQKTTSELMVE
jgi:hypothetical protein